MRNLKEKLASAAQLGRKHVWAILLALYPFADQIIAGVEAQMPALAPYLGDHVYRYVGLLIVAAKFGLQAWRAWQQLGVLLARKEG